MMNALAQAVADAMLALVICSFLAGVLAAGLVVGIYWIV